MTTKIEEANRRIHEYRESIAYREADAALEKIGYGNFVGKVFFYKPKVGFKETIVSFECEKCHDRGIILTENVGLPCDCVKKRVSLRALEKIGYGIRNLKSFESYMPKNKAQTKAKRLCEMFADDFCNGNDAMPWIVLSGQSGAGKTHLMQAVIKRIIESGKLVSMRVMRFVEDLQRMKDYSDENARASLLQEYCKCDLLYIDDFLKSYKGLTGEHISKPDLNQLFPLIDTRYRECLPTIISTELSVSQIIGFDEAIGGRIVERCNGNIVVFNGDHLNHRLKVTP